ncbi:MAG: hypothetical protein DME07_23845 [Candidatus Rokuibacteriota bacterium]|nr:MAG: hypothetical protein DME07_23845 [Candidatus Rokubacteria bacterium]
MAISSVAKFVGTSGALGVPTAPGCLRCPLERLASRNYCGGCGKPLRTRCERKQVTVLFADVSGFTAMSERLDPEQVSEIMHRTFDLVLEAVHEHGGTVNQFLGDGVMALFAEGPGEHRVRMAINTGPVVVGTIGTALRSDYAATSSTTSVATRLLRIAEPGEIVLTSRTRELAADRYDFWELGEMAVSQSETVEIYTLTRATMEYAG